MALIREHITSVALVICLFESTTCPWLHQSPDQYQEVWLGALLELVYRHVLVGKGVIFYKNAEALFSHHWVAAIDTVRI